MFSPSSRRAFLPLLRQGGEKICCKDLQEPVIQSVTLTGPENRNLIIPQYPGRQGDFRLHRTGQKERVAGQPDAESLRTESAVFLKEQQLPIRFKQTKEIFENLRFQAGTSNGSYGRRRYMPKAKI